MKDTTYLYLGSDRWVTRDSVPNWLLEKYHYTWGTAKDNPGVIDPATGRPFGAVWLNVADEILKIAGPVLDRDAMLLDRELRKRAADRELDAVFSRRRPWP